MWRIKGTGLLQVCLALTLRGGQGVVSRFRRFNPGIVAPHTHIAGLTYEMKAFLTT